MNAIHHISAGERYARCIQTSKRVRWDVDEDVIRGRHFDAAQKFLPDGLWASPIAMLQWCSNELSLM